MQNKRVGTRWASWVLLFGPLLVVELPAQTTLGTILGVATDPTGAVVPGVAVVVRNTGTNIEQRTTTNEAGLNEVSHLIPGRYSVTAEHRGFKTVRM